MDKTIKITIEGEVGIGKSTICDCIKKALTREGLHNWHVAEDNEDKPKQTYKDRIQSIKRRNPRIELETKQKERASTK